MKPRYVCMIAYTDFSRDARVRREAETLAANGFRVLCLITNTGGKPRQFVQNGVNVRELRVAKYRGKNVLAYLRSYGSFLFASSVACLGLLFRGELDVVHVHNLPDFLVFAGLLPRAVGKKVVLDVHDSIPETFASKFSRSFIVRKALCLEERVSARLAHRVICVNHPQRDRLVERGIPSGKTFISMNVPDPNIFRRPPVEKSPAESRGFHVVYHGTMAKRLGVDLLVEACARLRDRIPNMCLHLWGYGDDLSRFRDLARELKVEDRIEFNPKGFLLQDLPRALQSMDLGVVGNRVSPATELMLPVKLMEYVALGIPAVVPRLRTIEYYFSDDMVSYYEPEDVESLADAIYRLYRAPGLRCEQSERAMGVLAEHGWERQGPQLTAFYRDLVEN